MKKGLMYSTIAILAVVLISAAILIAFYWQFSGLFTERTDKGTCRATVELRGEQGILGEGAKLKIPLKCKTEYKCLTMGGKCPEGYTKIKVSTENDIKRELAYSMYDCWWMLGEGKLEFWTDSAWKEFGLAKVKSSCMICSEIAFDDQIYKKYPQIDEAAYLQTAVIQNKNMTYLEYFSDQKGAVLPTDVKVPAILTNQKYAVLFLGIEGDALWEPIVRDLGAVAAGLTGSMLTIGPANTGSILKWGGGIASKSVTLGGSTLTNLAGETTRVIGGTTVKLGYVGLVLAAAFMVTQTATTYWNQGIVASYCDGSKKGCMYSMMVPYSAFEIGKTCSNIESIP